MHEKLDAAARDNALDQLADFRPVREPGARCIKLEFEETLIERAHLRCDAHLCPFDLRSTEARHTLHFTLIPRAVMVLLYSLRY